MNRWRKLSRKVVAEVADGRILKRVPWAARAVATRLTAAVVGPRHMLPTFFIVGAMKSGTSFLNWMLSRHPQVLMCSKKEPNFFNLQYNLGLNWYRRFFPRKAQAQQRSAETGLPVMSGESSLYLSHPHAARRIARHLPGAKIIMLLRNPVQRTISDYHYMVWRGLETESLERAIALEPARLRGELDKMRADESYQSKEYLDHAYLARSVYVDQIQSFLQVLPRDQVLIMSSEEFYADNILASRRIQDFLGLTRWTPAYLRPVHGGRYSPAPPAIVEQLRRYFRPHNERLYDYLGIDFGWERRSMSAAA